MVTFHCEGILSRKLSALHLWPRSCEFMATCFVAALTIWEITICSFATQTREVTSAQFFTFHIWGWALPRGLNWPHNADHLSDKISPGLSSKPASSLCLSFPLALSRGNRSSSPGCHFCYLEPQLSTEGLRNQRHKCLLRINRVWTSLLYTLPDVFKQRKPRQSLAGTVNSEGKTHAHGL